MPSFNKAGQGSPRIVPSILWWIKPSLDKRFGHLLRALGLNIIRSSSWRCSSRAPKREKKKVVIHSSLSIAAAASSIHLVPITVSVFLIYMNINGWFIGQSLDGPWFSDDVKLALLQIAAKTQELLVVASLATMVFHLVRYELTESQGLSLGLVGSGISFTQLSFFWSPAFWSILKSSIRWKTKLRVALFLLVTGFLAAVVGPASAVLMIPSQRTWAAGGTPFWLKGNTDDLWPDFLSRRHIGGAVCEQAGAPQLPHCVSGGYLALLNHFTSFPWPPQGSSVFEIQSHYNGQAIAGANRYNPWNRPAKPTETWAHGAHGATTIMHNWLQNTWNAARYNVSGYYWRYQNAGPAVSFILTSVPVVRTVCGPVKLFTRNDTVMDFPVLPEYDYWDLPPGPISGLGVGPLRSLNISSTLSSLWERSDNNNLPFSTQWTPLTAEFGSVTTGVVTLGPSNGTSRHGTGCSIDARWTKAERTSAEHATKILSQRPGPGDRDFLPINDGTWRTIKADSDWLQALTPPVTFAFDGTNFTNSTTLENVLMARSIGLHNNDPDGLKGDELLLASKHLALPVLEETITAVVTEGISRVGLIKQAKGNALTTEYDLDPILYNAVPDFPSQLMRNGSAFYPPTSNGTSNFTQLQFRIQTLGYAFKAESLAGYASITVLFLYVTIAFSYTAFLLLWSRRTSACWDTLPELLALCLNSRPPATEVLGNTCAGIRRLDTMGRTACVRVTRGEGDEAGEGEELELVFDDGKRDGVKEDGTGFGRVEVNRCYGASSGEDLGLGDGDTSTLALLPLKGGRRV